MMKYPNVYNADNLINDPSWKSIHTGIDGFEVAPRPLGFASVRNRFYFAWKVFTGEWDALRWHKQ